MPIDQSRSVGTARGPLTRRFSTGHMLVLTAGLLALLANFAVLRARDDTSRVAVAAHDLAAGTILHSSGLRLVEVGVEPEILTTLVTGEEVASIEGRVVTRSIAAGDLVARSDLSEAAAPLKQRAMSIPIDRVHAAGGRITSSDVVDVIAVADGVAEYILLAAPVLDVADSSAAGIGSGGQYFVTVAVDALSALRIAIAMDDGVLEIVRATGAVGPTDLIYPAPLEDSIGGEADAGS